MEDQAVHVAGQTGQRDFGFGPLEADGADEAKGPADREAALAAEAGDRDVDTGPAIGYRQPSGLPGCCVAWARPAQPSPDPIFHTQRR